ncbi:DUF4286 family protein [Actinomadura algeriensis]|uniref:DUF4286 family protein n=1 Tax=Actinomadura algeriensis TaxID=1679523 RepID=A0ABR9K5G8_9ACTN|nr:DUF4286 family protein [Actinomadura algeriensis]MBE1537645.1 hypothetical protein [Actinomadura algeriensis]
MPKTTVLQVESYPSSPVLVDEFNRWYTEVHLREVLTVEGFVAARRFAPLEGNGPYVAQYEFEGDPKEAVPRPSRAAADGTLHMPDALRLDPPPRMLLLEAVGETHAAD